MTTRNAQWSWDAAVLPKDTPDLSRPQDQNMTNYRPLPYTRTSAEHRLASDCTPSSANRRPPLFFTPRGGRDNGPYADSFPLRCHFQGGGGVWGGGGGVGGQLEGAGGLQTPTYMV